MKTDCFAYRVGTSGKEYCDALKIMKCEGCSFYKTKEQVAADEAKTQKRLKEIKWLKGGVK